MTETDVIITQMRRDIAEGRIRPIFDKAERRELCRRDWQRTVAEQEAKMEAAIVALAAEHGMLPDDPRFRPIAEADPGLLEIGLNFSQLEYVHKILVRTKSAVPILEQDGTLSWTLAQNLRH
jgi:hypothetical protein